MTNQQILEKAIQKAIDGGWFMDYSKAKDKWRAFQREYTIEEDGIHHKTYDCQECFRAAYEINDIIFYHDFAKSLFGEDIGAEAATYESHYIPARGYPGQKIPKEEIKDAHIEENWNCTRCGRKWASCFTTACVEIRSAVKGRKGWKYHLQQMAIADDPIKYLGEHI